MHTRGVIVLGALVVMTGAVLLATVPALAQARKYVALGCLSREAPAANGTGGTFIITDGRSDTPLVYKLDGDEKELTFHLGHTIEVSGTLSPAPQGATGPNAKAMVLKVTSLAYISPSCKFLK